MALFQPTNIIPSISTNSGTVSVADTMQVQWQVNGNSAMIAYQIDVLKNDPYSTFVHTTGRITDGCPFYGTDRFGKPQFFTYNSNKPWGNWSALATTPMTDGNNYKLKITQWYSADQTVVSGIPSTALSAGTTYYFTISGGGYVTYTPTTAYSTVDTFYYNATKKKAWVVLGSNNRLIQLTMAHSDTQPTTGTKIGTMTVNATASKEDFVQQSSASPFITRNQPTVAIQVCESDDYANPSDFTSGELNSSIGYFHADYKQAQNDPVRWIQWQVASASNGVAGDILADTGDIYTSTLDYEFNGFFVGYDYAIRCIIESENGLQADTGWVVFTVKVATQGSYTGKFTAQCLPRENAALLEWEGVEVINGTADPTDGYSVEGGAVTLTPNSSITWERLDKDGNNSPFATPWTAAWKGEIVSQKLTSENVDLLGTTTNANLSSLQTTVTIYDGKVISSVDERRYFNATDWIHTPSSQYPYVSYIRLKFTGEVLSWDAANLENDPSIAYCNVFHVGGTILDITLYSYETPSLQNSYIDVTVATRIEYVSTRTIDGQIIKIGITNVDENVIDNDISFSGDTFTVKLYAMVFRAVQISLNITYANNYYVTLFQTMPYAIAAYSLTSISPNVIKREISYVGKILIAKLYTQNQNESVSASFIVDYIAPYYDAQGTLLTLNGAEITLFRQGNPLILKFGDTELASITPPETVTSAAIVLTPTTVNAFFYADNALLSSTQIDVDYTQQPITTVQINGGDDGVTVESVSVYQGDGTNILDQYANYGFEPVWNSESYDLHMTANFNSGIGGGTGNAEGDGFRVYRQEYGSSYLTPIANLGATTTSLKDYGLSSRKAYQYYLCVYDNNKAYMGQVQAMSVNYPDEVAVIATSFKNYSLMVCSYDNSKDEYHVRKQYLFALDLKDNGSSNNNSPTINANFTPYPTVMKSVQNYKSGTLSALIGTIYTKQALIEQIGNYKRTAMPSTLDYFDSVDLEKELYDLSVTPYTLFLRDMKGHLRMVQASGAITQTPYIKSTKQQITISFPWVEVGDASDVTVIQTPSDYGWDYDNEALDIRLNVNTATGELSAAYPYPYNGTTFFLTGANMEKLAVKTANGVTPARFNLSNTATKTTDGQVTATVKINKEEE